MAARRLAEIIAQGWKAETALLAVRRRGGVRGWARMTTWASARISDWAAPFSPVGSGTVIMSPAARRDVWRTATLMRLVMLGGPRPAQLP